ncbi:MAG: hypothetical protein Q4B42_06195 [Oscillospiraceae bacterium]|nr:hypothetical protein [Oscillospiraceae bacterium]
MNNHIDFLADYNRKPEMPSSKKTLLGFIAAGVLLAGGCTAVFFVMNTRLRALEAQCQAEQSYINDAQTASRLAEYEEVYAEYQRELALSEELESARFAIDSYPNVNSALLRAVNEAAGDDTDLMSVSYADSSGVITLSGSSSDYHEGAAYAARLEALNRFVEVGYHGYYESDGSYVFEDNCILNPGTTTQR